MQRLITIRDLKNITSIDFANLLVSQFRFQSSRLSQLRFRRREINAAFKQMSSTRTFEAGENDRCLHWAESSRKALSGAFERLAVDGVAWGGQLQNSLNEQLNQLCRHSVHSLMCFDLLLSSIEYYSNSGDLRESECATGKLLAYDIDLKAILEESTVPDMESLTKEKFGACPAISVVQRDMLADDDRETEKPATLPYGSPSLLSFVMVELMKNSLEAVLNKYGVLDLDDAESGTCVFYMLLLEVGEIIFFLFDRRCTCVCNIE